MLLNHGFFWLTNIYCKAKYLVIDTINFVFFFLPFPEMGTLDFLELRYRVSERNLPYRLLSVMPYFTFS